ncbi:MAG: class I SAM-dependent rRNA methyltransferase [Gemmataceae bacterium]|nr:class I SAM-dependent rRNA methyltransferase [Gemmataceae bacterium]
MPEASIILQPKKARPFYARHPWVFAGAVARVEGEPADGGEVDLLSHTGNFIARGFFNSKSKIRVRLFSWEQGISLDREFFKTRLQNAMRLRQDLGLLDAQGACRLVASEGDFLSGLTVDRYGQWLVAQFTSLGMGQRKDLIAGLLMELAQPKGILLRTEKGIGKLEGLEFPDEWVGSAPTGATVPILEHGCEIQVSMSEGQKTGYYLDQRDNRLAASKFAAGKRVLDVFCYGGGFTLHCLKQGASQCLGIDQSASALQLAELNLKNNQLANATWVQGDAFDELDKLATAGEKFGMVILDPPRFSRGRDSVDEALGGYRRLHTLALRLLEPDGFLVSCCCSGSITMDMMVDLIAQVGSKEKREIRILEKRGPAPDHPVAVSCLESGYLKCLVSFVR